MSTYWKNNPRVIIAADFETTTDDPHHVEVWSAESIEVGYHVPSISSYCSHQTNIADFMKHMEELSSFGADVICYFHNLKFDGSYILDYLTRSNKYHLFSYDVDNTTHLLDMDKVLKKSRMNTHDYTYMISDRNVIYSIRIKTARGYIEFRDSAKLLPFSLRQIAKDFHTKHQKLEMDYGHKQPGYNPTPEEMKYIENDVFVLKEALEILADLSGYDVDELPMTIGAMAMKEFKKLFKEQYGEKAWDKYFPDQTKKIPNAVEDLTYDGYVRRSYKGGWCYVSPTWQGKVITQRTVIDYLHSKHSAYEKRFHKPTNSIGFVYDVNSLYPSVMSSESGCFYPVGHGTYSLGDFTPDEVQQLNAHKLYGFMHVQLQFKIKPEHLPTIQIKGDFNYNATEWLTSSDVYLKKWSTYVPNTVDLYLTYIDWLLIQKHYDLTAVNIISHITYKTASGLFDNYISKWAHVKQTSKGAKRAFAKLMLNNLYGKFSTSPLASYMVCSYDKTTMKVNRTPVELIDSKRAVFIPTGSAITSWARNFTISHAQENFDLFCYADTDSIHCIGTKDMARNIKEHPTAFCCWKNETNWQSAIFAGQKRYIERVTAEDGTPIDKWYYNIKCCGMSDGAKKNLNRSLCTRSLHLSDFKPGLIVPGVLKGHVVSGGTYLQESSFEFH